jgi:3-keto-disaccharide hydrolase
MDSNEKQPRYNQQKQFEALPVLARPYIRAHMTKSTLLLPKSLGQFAAIAITIFTCAGSNSIAGEWRALFNGKDLTNWTQNGSARWTVKDGIILGGQDGDPKKAGLLATKEKFKDFELELEFMIDEHGKYNSGVYLRNNPDTAGRTGYQVNIGRPAAQEFIGLYTDRWLAKGDESDVIRKKLDWNKLYIFAQAGHIKARLNGIEIFDYTDPAPASKFLQTGVLGLQTYGAEGYAGWVKFRNIRIRELD